MRSLVACSLFVVSGGLVALAACVGDDPAPGVTPNDGGSSGALVDRVGGDETGPNAEDGSSSSRECDPDGKFGTPRLLGGLHADNNTEGEPSLTADERTIYFGRTTASGPSQLFYATRVGHDDDFAIAQRVPFADADAAGHATNEYAPSVRADNRALAWLRADSVASNLRLKVWTATRAAPDAPFGLEARIELEAGAPSQEIGVTLAPDGGIFFDSNPNPELGDQYTVYRARLLDAGGLADLSSVKGLESENLQRQLVFTGDGRRVYFTSTRISPNGHIYTSTRLTPEAPWSPPTLVEELASDQTDLAGSVSPNGCRIYFASNRDTTFKIYVASKR